MVMMPRCLTDRSPLIRCFHELWECKWQLCVNGKYDQLLILKLHVTASDRHI